MKKDIIVCIIVICFIITLDLITKFYTESVVKEINDSLIYFKDCLLKDDNTKDFINNKINEIMSNWKQKYYILAYYIEHDELEKVEMELTSLLSYINVEKYNEGIENIDRCIFILNHIKEKYSLKIKNVF